jgi:ABC-2 type transport system permease protein
MVLATLYIMWCSAKNRMRRRLRRLREPRYLIGAIVGAAYLFFALYGRTRPRARRLPESGQSPGARQAQSVIASFAVAAPSLGGLALLVAAAVSWLMPFGSGLLEFTQAETAFLFPAPVARRQLLFYRLMRSQWAVFFGALVMSLAYPIATIPARLRGLIAIWLILMTAHVFFTGVTLSRPQVRRHAATSQPLARFMMIAIFAALSVVLVSVGRHIWNQPILTLTDAYHVVSTVASTGAAHLVLIPFIALVRPLFATGWLEFLKTIPGAILVYAVVIAWVLRADEAFGAMTEELTDAQANRPSNKHTAYQVRNVGWNLALTGRSETPFVWKGALQTFRIVDRRVLIRVGVMIGWLTMVVALFGRARGLAQAIGLMATFAAVFASVIGPQILRVDLRQDLQHLEVLKTWPVRAAAVVRGEMLWPAAVITTLAWVFGAVGIFLSAATFSSTALSLRIAGGLAGMILAPAFIIAQFTIHNTAALLFPAWVPLGMGRPRGVDAMGQRLFMLGATWFMLILMVAPGVIAGGILSFAFRRWVGWWILIPAAAICTSIVGVEVLMATEALGPAYERLDLTSVERGD